MLKLFNIVFIFIFISFCGFETLNASQKLPVDGELTAAQIDPSNAHISIRLRVVSGLEFENVSILLELPEGVEALEGNLIFYGKLNKDEELVLNSKIKLIMNGIFKIGARLIVHGNSVRQSKLFILNIEKQGSAFNIVDSNLKSQENSLPDQNLLKKSQEGEIINRAKKID
jgi:hypothetical protein